MKKIIIIYINVVLVLGFFIPLHPDTGPVFDPARDGWYFENEGREGLSWDLFRKTYIGINPTKDCVAAPLDCAFYELFKDSGKNGVCGGMSILALALYKYGGYMGYCSPAKFYTGVLGPDRADLYDAISIIQARQFSASGIRNFLDDIDAGNLNNAHAAFNAVKENLGKSDYPVISLAKNAVGEDAHILIPYKVEELGVTKIMYLWDPNHPFDDDPNDYGGASYNGNNKMIISSPTNWTYRAYSGSGSGGAWCFCIPMSKVLVKSRHPMTLDMVFTALMTVFVKGTGSAITQVTDNEGHRLFKEGQPGVPETDPSRRLKGAAKWAWFGQTGGGFPGDLIFIRRENGQNIPLNITVSGGKYEAFLMASGNLVKLDSLSTEFATDVIKFDAVSSAVQSVELETTGVKRMVSVMQLRTGTTQKEWRRFDVKNLAVTRDTPVMIHATENFKSIQVSGKNKPVSFDLEIQQRMNNKTTIKTIQKLTVDTGKVLKMAPKDWDKLDKTDIVKETFDKEKK